MEPDPRFLPDSKQFLDAPFLSQSMRTLTGGMNNKDHPVTLNTDEATLIQNWEVRQGSFAEKRSGTVPVFSAVTTPTSTAGLGLGYWNPPLDANNQRIMLAEPSGFWSWDGSSQWQSLGGVTPIGLQPVKFVQGRRSRFPTAADVGYFIQKGSDRVVEFDGTTTFTASGSPNGTVNSIPPAVDGFSWLERLWIAGDGIYNGYIFHSEFGEPSRFDISRGYQIDPSDEMVAIREWLNNGIMVFNRNSIWLLHLDQASFGDIAFDSTFITRVNTDVGCVARDSLVQAGHDFFFLSRYGVHRLSKTERDQPLGVVIPASDKIQDTIDRINWSYAYKAQGAYWDNKYLLSVPLDIETENSTTLVYDLREDAWTIFDGFVPGSWTMAHFGTNEDRIFFVDGQSSTDLEVYEFDVDGQEADDGLDITSVIETPRYDWGTTDRKKQFQYVELFLDSSTGGTLEVSVAPDNDLFQVLGTMTVTPNGPVLPIRLPFQLTGSGTTSQRFYLDHLGSVNEVQFRFRAVGQSKVKILYFNLAAYIDAERF